ncbi:MAG TPA: NADH-quinone oxidoreductase subunit L, partial [Terriglobia bacterium]|nr:NADH-quinone oxidoreductase subunit L [Terriglobia bacterium]
RSSPARAGREAPWVMITPLMLLAIPAFASGFGFVAKFFVYLPGEKHTGWLVPGVAFAATLAGMTLAIILYRDRESDPIDFALVRKGFGFDEAYAFAIRATQGVLATISAFIDRWILDAGFVRGAGGATWGFGSLLRLLQVGNLQAYSFLFGLGIVGLIYFTLFR